MNCQVIQCSQVIVVYLEAIIVLVNREDYDGTDRIETEVCMSPLFLFIRLLAFSTTTTMWKNKKEGPMLRSYSTPLSWMNLVADISHNPVGVVPEKAENASLR
jgi:hypothetical protein